ncbi:MAG: hypothetical protein ACRC5M_05070 [Anaeroplasmataceae bacterium]
MNKHKKVVLIIFSFLTLITLASCSSNSKINSTFPLGDLTEKNYATSKYGSISEVELYNSLRHTGYEKIESTLKNQMYKDYIALVDYDNNEEHRNKVNLAILKTMYNVTDEVAYNKIPQWQKNQLKLRFITERESRKNPITTDSFTIEVKDEKNSNITKVDIDWKQNDEIKKTIIDEFIVDVAIEVKAMQDLLTLSYKETVDSVSNDYYISEDDIEKFYHERFKYYGKSQAIVLKFINRSQADRISESFIESSNPENNISQYIAMYNNLYKTREELTIDNYLNDENVNFSKDIDHLGLSSFSGEVENLVVNKMKDNDFFSTPKNVDGNYYMIYKISSDKIKEWYELDKTSDEFQKIQDEIRSILLDTEYSSDYQTKLRSDREKLFNEEANFLVYDPFVAYQQYIMNKENFKFTNKFNDDLIYEFSFVIKADGVLYTEDKTISASLSVREYYDITEDKYGTEVSYELISLEFARHKDQTNFYNSLTNDEIKAVTDEINSEVKKFKKGKNPNFPKKIGESIFLYSSYGATTKAEAIELLKTELVVNKISSYIGTHTTDGKNFDQNDYFFNQFAKIYEDFYENQFDTTISHILISVDEDNDGNFENPYDYANSLSDSLRTKFEDEVVLLANTIIAETNMITNKNIDSLKSIKYSYEQGDKIYSSDSNETWNKFKTTFNFVLTVESLGSVSNSNFDQYELSFSKRAKELYQRFTQEPEEPEQPEEPDENSRNSKLGPIQRDFSDSFEELHENGYLEFSDENDEKLIATSQLATTSYGFHILNLESISDKDSSLFTKDNDYKPSDSDFYDFENRSITVIPDGTDEDDKPDKTLITNLYSENKYASPNQLFVYYYEYNTDEGIVNMKSSLESSIRPSFDQIVEVIDNLEFHNLKIYMYIGKVDFAQSRIDNEINKKVRKITEYNIFELDVDKGIIKGPDKDGNGVFDRLDYKFYELYLINWRVDLSTYKI